MRERPIVFSTEMIQAILREENPKTNTRRVSRLEKINNDIRGDWQLFSSHSDSGVFTQIFISIFRGNIKLHIKCPYGQVGDILWVKEIWTTGKHGVDGIEYLYKADNLDNVPQRWKPSIYMPKDACRIRLKIKSIRVERLLDISEQDAIAEGIQKHEGAYSWSAQTEYFILWDKINGLNSHNKNPYVWVIEFERLI